jgi:hypothetical protein
MITFKKYALKMLSATCSFNAFLPLTTRNPRTEIAQSADFQLVKTDHMTGNAAFDWLLIL